MDGGILLISAADGVMPQSKEHIVLAKQIGVQHLIATRCQMANYAIKYAS